MAKGKLIVIEGADGCGKSTHTKLLAEYLASKGHEVVPTQEPTRGLIGQTIRKVLSGEEKVTPEALALMFTADRAQHVDQVIKPALESGKTVITDRYYYSTVAYQSVQGVDRDWISQLNSFVPEPDIVLVLKIKSEDALARMDGRTREVFEVLHFQKKVQQELLEMAEGGYKSLSKPGKYWEVINNVEDVDKVQEGLRKTVDTYLK